MENIVVDDSDNPPVYPAIRINGRTSKIIAKSTSALAFNSRPAHINYNNPVYQLTYTTKSFGSITEDGEVYPDAENVTYHNEHAFFFPSWCGDGVVDTQFGEKFDDGINNGRPGFASTDCQKKNPPKPPVTPGICDGASTGVPTETAPTNLCKTGTPSAVVKKNGKFTWTCGGINGGANATCEAPKKDKPVPPPITPEKCDQTFSKKIRLGYAYRFGDYYTNNNTFAHTLNSFVVNFRENHGDDMNRDGKFTYDNFRWADGYYNGVTIPAKAKSVKIIEAHPSYNLSVAPKKRQQDNIYIEYIINGKGNGNFTHKECINYEVTWCGDGVLDVDQGEKCDPKDSNKTNW